MEYVFEFFKTGGNSPDGCCNNNEVHQIINWNYTPPNGVSSNIEILENTVYNNNASKYIYIKGDNILDDEEKLIGSLELQYRCVDKCNLINQKNETQLRAIQIEGFAAAITGPNDSIFIPVGDQIKVQLLGGFGSTRFATSSSSSVASVSPRVGSESSNYRPEMQILGEAQVDDGCFEVDTNLGEGNHIFTITIKDSGPVNIVFKDEAGCNLYLNLYGVGNLCSHTIDSPDLIGSATNYRKRNVDSKWITEENGIKRQQTSPCNCDFSWGNPFTKTYSLARILSGGLGNFNVYESEEFAHGTRSLDLTKLEDYDDKLFITHVVDKRVGQSYQIPSPSWGKNWNAAVVISETKGSWGGHGYDSDNMLSWNPSLLDNDRDFIKADNLTLNFKQPTNHAPVLINVYSSNGSAMGPPNPAQPKQINSQKNAGGDLVYIRRNGNKSSIYLEDYANAGPNEIFMTNDNWFMAVRAFCPSTQEPGLKPKTQTVIEDDFFQIGFNRLDGDLSYISPNNNSWYFAPTDVGRPSNVEIKDNIVRSPDLDDKAPQRNKDAEFQVGPGNQDSNTAYATVTIFAEPWIFWSASESIESFPGHKECVDAFATQYFQNGDFYSDMSSEALGDHKHDTSITAYDAYEDEGLTAQVRGSWCLQNNTFRVDLESKIAVFEKDGKPKMIFDRDNKEVIVPEKLANGKRSYKFSSKGIAGPIQNNI